MSNRTPEKNRKSLKLERKDAQRKRIAGELTRKTAPKKLQPITTRECRVMMHATGE
jgi:hypothetical protein